MNKWWLSSWTVLFNVLAFITYAAGELEPVARDFPVLAPFAKHFALIVLLGNLVLRFKTTQGVSFSRPVKPDLSVLEEPSHDQ